MKVIGGRDMGNKHKRFIWCRARMLLAWCKYINVTKLHRKVDHLQHCACHSSADGKGAGGAELTTPDDS